MFFYVPSDVKITLNNPKKFWEIFNLILLVPPFSWTQLSRITSKNNANLTLGYRKKIINKFPTLPPRAGGVLEIGKIPYFYFFLFLNPSLTDSTEDRATSWMDPILIVRDFLISTLIFSWENLPLRGSNQGWHILWIKFKKSSFWRIKLALIGENWRNFFLTIEGECKGQVF